MPSVNLNDVPQREVFAGFSGRFVHSQFMTFAHWEIKAGAALPSHSHPHEQVVNMIEGEFELTSNGVTQRLGPRSVAVIPPNAMHSGRAITDCRILDVFHPVREDYRS